MRDYRGPEDYEVTILLGLFGTLMAISITLIFLVAWERYPESDAFQACFLILIVLLFLTAILTYRTESRHLRNAALGLILLIVNFSFFLEISGGKGALKKHAKELDQIRKSIRVENGK